MKVTKGITYIQKKDEYVVRDSFGVKSHNAVFPTLESAQEYYNALVEERTRIKIADMLYRARSEQRRKYIPESYPINLLETLDRYIDNRETRQLVADVVLGDKLDTYLKKLPEREQIAIKLYYEKYNTLEITGKQFKVTRERARQILAKATRRLYGIIWRCENVSQEQE